MHIFLRIPAFVVMFLIGLADWTSGSAAAEKPVIVFAAASLKPALDQLAADMKPGSVQFAFGGSSGLARQIQFGAPADIFISANQTWMEVLDEANLLEPDSRRDLLGNRIVLISRAADADFANIDQALTRASAGDRIAMALTKAVPAGIYGRDALVSLGLWEQAKSRVVQANDVRGALRFVAAGEVRFGIVYATDPGSNPAIRVIGTFPQDSHDPIRYPIAMIGSPDTDTRRVYDILTSDKAMQLFQSHGFIVVTANQ